jgi:hypothetical protein
MSNWNTDYKRVCFGAAASFITSAKEESRRGDEAQSCRMETIKDVPIGRAFAGSLQVREKEACNQNY